MRPRNLSEVLGQEHVLGPGKLLRRAIENGYLFSMILWGPPGCGKSSIARLIAEQTGARMVRLSAVTAGVSEIRSVVSEASSAFNLEDVRTVLFIDEIHRFNKSQQDALLPHVEDGTIVLIGATTENPRFALTPPLVSRCQLVELKPLSREVIKELVLRAVQDGERGLGKLGVVFEEGALDMICSASSGDARVALNLLELAVRATTPDSHGRVTVTCDSVREAAAEAFGRSVKDEEIRYDLISAFIKSIRGSHPDAAVYWLARMIAAGEDLEFIARRLVISAAEDVGNADPMGLVVANAAAEAARRVGWPEAQIPLAQATIYLACAPKSNTAYTAISRAMEDVRARGSLEVPENIRFHGTGYLYPHDFPGHWVRQKYMPDELEGARYVLLSDMGFESKMKHLPGTGNNKR
ncbi:MAG: replication-associated recombination protein A [Bacillota bacterium]